MFKNLQSADEDSKITLWIKIMKRKQYENICNIPTFFWLWYNALVLRIQSNEFWQLYVPMVTTQNKA